MSTKIIIAVSKFISFVLRHRPESIGLSLDKEGWADIDMLIAGAKEAGTDLDIDLIRKVVLTSDKKRFSISDDGKRVRAVQGHSVANVKLSHAQKTPPVTLYHGTASRYIDSIKSKGLIAGSRHHVHLSSSDSIAIDVGRRHGKPVVISVMALEMHRQGFRFFQAQNGVWLTDHVPAKFLSHI